MMHIVIKLRGGAWGDIVFSSFLVFIMPQGTMTITSATPPVTEVCFRALLIIATVKMTPTTVGQSSSSYHDVVLQPQLIPRDTMRSSDGLTTVMQ